MKNEFTIEGIVRYKPKGIGLKVETAEGKYKTTHEILCFHGENGDLDEGDEVTVAGNIGSKKSEFTREYNGKQYPIYLTQLIAREVTKRGTFAEQKAPPPRKGKDPDFGNDEPPF